MPFRGSLSRALLAVALGAAMAAAGGLGAGASVRSPWEMHRPSNPRRTGAFENPKLTESSGVAASSRQPGILWTLNDSGNEPLIFATDTLGRDRGAFRVVGAENEDWEAISLGPCGTGECLYIADTGDNLERRASARLYRVPEPSLSSTARSTRRAEALDLRYPGGPRDVEAAFVGSDGTVYLISKGRDGVVQAYRVPASAWTGTEFLAAPIGTLPIETGDLGALVTDAALHPSGELVAVRTYRAIFLFRLAAGHTLRPLGVGCDTAGLQLQGEGISWFDHEELVLTSEAGFGSPGTIVLLRCHAT
ncbi:hypothetical protein BH24GEM1_BH24GEM1_11080 [soil metagenome]